MTRPHEIIQPPEHGGYWIAGHYYTIAEIDHILDHFGYYDDEHKKRGPASPEAPDLKTDLLKD